MMKQKQNVITMIHEAYNVVYDTNPKLAQLLMHDYLTITEQNQSYQLVAAKMQGYLNQYLLTQQNVPQEVITLAQEASKIAQSYVSFATSSTWFPFL